MRDNNLSRRKAVVLRVVAVTIAAVLTTSTCSSGHPKRSGYPAFPRIVGWLHAQGQRLVDGRGRTVELDGIEIGGLAAGAGAPGDQGLAATGCRGWLPPSPSVYGNVVTWGFNSVRVAISWANIEPTPPVRLADGVIHHAYDERYLRTVDAVIGAFARRGIAVVLEFAQAGWSPAFKNVNMKYGVACQGVGMPAWLYRNGIASGLGPRVSFFRNAADVQQGYVDAWRMIAARYARDHAVVGFDLFNEPPSTVYLSPADLHLAELYTKIASAIRSVNAGALLIFQDAGVGPGQEALQRPPPFRDIVYSFHYYVDNWLPDGERSLMVQWARARRWGVPFYIGETDLFGYASPHERDPRWATDARAMLSFCRSNGISWNVFQYAGGWFLGRGTGGPKPGVLAVLREASASTPRGSSAAALQAVQADTSPSS